MNIKLSKSDIIDCEVELTGYCNLKCQLCMRQYKDAQSILGVNIRPVSDWINQLNQYPNLKSICIAGIISEPTLYPELFQFIKYLKSRNITIELYTNANTHTPQWWKELNDNYLTECDKVIFTICGSTQELHEKYRVGSSLQQILDNAAAFRDLTKKNDWIQHIKFQYNIDDFNQNMGPIIDQFSNKILIHSSAYNERFNIIDRSTGLTMVRHLSTIYDRIANIANQKKVNLGLTAIDCKSFETKFISFDQYGRQFPCFLYRLYSPDTFNLDYTDILKYKYDFCYECEHQMHNRLNQCGLERMV